MDDQIVAIYSLCDDLLQALHHRDDPQAQMSDAEVMTTALVATLFFAGNYEHSRHLLDAPRYIPHMLSRSRFCRRLHRIEPLCESFFAVLSRFWIEQNTESTYLLDSFPVAALENIRIKHARLYHDPAYRGFIPSSRRFFYGLKIHLLTTCSGEPVEFFFTPGSVSDSAALKRYRFDLPEGSTVYADRAYNDYAYEEMLAEAAHLRLQPMRKNRSRRPFPPYVAYLQSYLRKRIETSGSLIAQRMPRSIHATTPAGFELKVFLFVLAFSLQSAL